MDACFYLELTWANSLFAERQSTVLALEFTQKVGFKPKWVTSCSILGMGP